MWIQEYFQKGSGGEGQGVKNFYIYYRRILQYIIYKQHDLSSNIPFWALAISLKIPK